MSALDQLVRLHDLDLLRQQAGDAAAGLERARTRLVGPLEPRWLHIYERARGRYGRGVAAVRGRVCQGCHITLPTSALPAPDAPKMCESCGRILCWR